MFSPEQQPYLENQSAWVNIADIDRVRFPNFHKAVVNYDDELLPGEILFIPQGWYHHIETLEDSVSLTWNFVHASQAKQFHIYLASNDVDRDVIDYFLAKKIF
jgi:hypothetical protein